MDTSVCNEEIEMRLGMKLTMNRLKDMAACRLISHIALLTTGDLPNTFARPWGLSHLLE
jgi:hypothetical protein